MLCCLLAASLALAACSRQESAWRSSQQQDTPAAYENYLRDYPAGAHVGAARLRLGELREQQDWERATRFDTPESFQRYLAGYPAGRFAATARERLSGFLPAAASGDGQGVAGALPAAASEAGGYRVQLGAFRDGEAAARRAWGELRGRHADLVGTLSPQVDLVSRDGRDLWRLQAGPLSEARAREVCAALELRGVACLPVPR
jgi:hypothetical protein